MAALMAFFPKLVFHCDERSAILVVKRLLSREDGKIKVKVEVHDHQKQQSWIPVSFA